VTTVPDLFVAQAMRLTNKWGLALRAFPTLHHASATRRLTIHMDRYQRASTMS
jgi:hypothetical protein